MFSIYHFIWIGICLAIIVVSLVYIRKKKLTLKDVLPFCCGLSVISEAVKTISVLRIVPSSDGTMYYPYLELQYFPFHMCSLLIFVIFYCNYGKNEKLKNLLLGFLYPAGVLGGIMAIMMPSIFSTSISPEQSFASPLAYQTFIYHAMLIVLGIVIVSDKENPLKKENYKSSVTIAGTLTFLSLYLNSLFAEPVYKDSVLQSVEYTTNFFFTYRTPIGIRLTTKRQWGLYLLIIVVLAIVLMYLLYLPVFRREKKNR